MSKGKFAQITVHLQLLHHCRRPKNLLWGIWTQNRKIYSLQMTILQLLNSKILQEEPRNSGYSSINEISQFLANADQFCPSQHKLLKGTPYLRCWPKCTLICGSNRGLIFFNGKYLKNLEKGLNSICYRNLPYRSPQMHTLLYRTRTIWGV